VSFGRSVSIDENRGPIRIQREGVGALGEDTVRFLTQRKVEVKAASMRACVESLVATCRRQSEAEELNTQMLAYYDGISDQERAENTAWGQMAEDESKSVEI
jgi:hypothetical protein